MSDSDIDELIDNQNTNWAISSISTCCAQSCSDFWRIMDNCMAAGIALWACFSKVRKYAKFFFG